MRLLDPLLHRAVELGSDIRKIVLNSFWKHNKDIDLSAQSKAVNTEMFLRYLLERAPSADNIEGG
jgi:hypothetical protein